MKVYSLGSPFGKVPCESLQAGHNKDYPVNFTADPIAVWGQLRGAKDLLAKSKHFYRMDHAYVGRLDYYRITRNDFQPSRIVERPADRWEKLKKQYKLNMGPWQKGKHILVTLSDARTYEFFGLLDWPDRTRAAIAKHTDRPIVLRSRTESRPLAEQLKGAWAVVTYASNTVVDSLLAGVPVFTLGPSIARPVGLSDVSRIESPHYPENREEFFRHMAYCQFDCLEFNNGFAVKTADENWDTATRSSAPA